MTIVLTGIPPSSDQMTGSDDCGPLCLLLTRWCYRLSLCLIAIACLTKVTLKQQCAFELGLASAALQQSGLTVFSASFAVVYVSTA